jgi:hypothetical protein
MYQPVLRKADSAQFVVADTYHLLMGFDFLAMLMVPPKIVFFLCLCFLRLSIHHVTSQSHSFPLLFYAYRFNALHIMASPCLCFSPPIISELFLRFSGQKVFPDRRGF